MMDPSQYRRLAWLTDRLVEERNLSTSDLEELNQLLLGSADARSFYRDYLNLHVSLDWDQAYFASSISSTKNVIQMPASSRWMAVAAMLIIFLSALFAWNLLRTTPQEIPGLQMTQFNTLESVHLTYEVPQYVEQGLIQLTLANGTRLVVEGPAQFTLTQNDGLHLASGSVSADLLEIGTDFSVHTPHAVLIGHGAQFALSVTEQGTHVGVFNGQAEARAGDQTLTLAKSDHHFAGHAGFIEQENSSPLWVRTFNQAGVQTYFGLDYPVAQASNRTMEVSTTVPASIQFEGDMVLVHVVGPLESDFAVHIKPLGKWRFDNGSNALMRVGLGIHPYSMHQMQADGQDEEQFSGVINVKVVEP